jgi:hypothetical protein
MAIRIDPALNTMPQRLQDEFRYEVGGVRGGPISAAVLPLNSVLLDRQARIEALERTVKAALPAMREYARANPKHYYRDALQDPCGVHAWLASNDR